MDEVASGALVEEVEALDVWPAVAALNDLLHFLILFWRLLCGVRIMGGWSCRTKHPSWSASEKCIVNMKMQPILSLHCACSNVRSASFPARSEVQQLLPAQLWKNAF